MVFGRDNNTTLGKYDGAANFSPLFAPNRIRAAQRHICRVRDEVANHTYAGYTLSTLLLCFDLPESGKHFHSTNWIPPRSVRPSQHGIHHRSGPPARHCTILWKVRTVESLPGPRTPAESLFQRERSSSMPSHSGSVDPLHGSRLPCEQRFVLSVFLVSQSISASVRVRRRAYS